METQASKSLWLPLVVTGIVVILSSSAGIARMMGWGSGSTRGSGDILAPDQRVLVPAASEARARPSCPECGVIVSVQKVGRRVEDDGPGAAAGTTGGNGEDISLTKTGSYEITVRMADGSNRVNEYANPAQWRIGERLIVIGGAGPSSR